MAWQDQDRRNNFGRGDSYRPSERSRVRSRSRHRDFCDDRDRNGDFDARPKGPSRNNSAVFGYDGAQPPARGSVTPSIESPRSPARTIRDETQQPPTGPSAMVVDPRLHKRQPISFALASKPNGPVTPAETTGPTIAATNFEDYLRHLVQVVDMENDTIALQNQLAGHERQKKSFLELHPEAKEVQAQIEATIKQVKAKIGSVEDCKKKKLGEIDAAVSAMPQELRSLIRGTLPERSTRAHCDTQRDKIDFTALHKEVELLKTRDKLREAEKQELEKQMLTKFQANEEKWSSRMKALEDLHRLREEEARAFKADLLAEFEQVKQERGRANSSSTESEINELKKVQKEHKLNFANLASQFVPAQEFRNFRKELDGGSRSSGEHSLTNMKTQLQNVGATVNELGIENKATKDQVGKLVEDVTLIKADLTAFKELEGKYAEFWKNTTARLTSVEIRTHTLQNVPQQLTTLENKFQSHVSDNDVKQKKVDGQISTLETKSENTTARPAFSELQTEIRNLTSSFDQRFQAFTAKANQQMQAATVSLPSNNAGPMGFETQEQLSSLKTDVAKLETSIHQSEFAIKDLNTRYNQISGGALYREILRVALPSLQRIPELEESNKVISARMDKIETDTAKIEVEVVDLKDQAAQSTQSAPVQNEGKEKISELEMKLVELSRNQANLAAHKDLTDLRTRVHKVEEFEAHLPALYFTKENGDDLDKRFHALESLEIRGDLEDLRKKYNTVKDYFMKQQDENDDFTEDIRSLRKTLEQQGEYAQNLKSVCDSRQQEIDAREGEVEAISTRISKAENNLVKLKEHVERLDEETKADIGSMKEEIATVTPTELSFLRIEQLASSFKTVDDIRGKLQGYTVYQAWFGGGKTAVDRTTYQAIISVNKADADDIITFFSNQQWSGRTVKIKIIEKNARLETLIHQLKSPTPGPEFRREATAMTSTHGPSLPRALPTSPLASNFEGAALASKRAATAHSSQKASSINRPGTKATPVVIPDSQEPDETAGNEGSREDDDERDTIRVRSSDPGDLSAWTGVPPGKSIQKARNSPLGRSRVSLATPSTGRKRANQENDNGANKKARQT